MSVQVDLVEEAKQMLLVTATPDSMARLSETNLRRQEKEQLCEVYFNSHFTDLGQSLEHALQASRQLLFVTTHSRLLTRQGKESLAQSLNVSVKILPLEQINTESQFAEEISHFLRTTVGRPKILLVQYQFHRKEQNSLIDCARYVIQNKLNELPSVPQQCCIAMVLQVSFIPYVVFRCISIYYFFLRSRGLEEAVSSLEFQAILGLPITSTNSEGTKGICRLKKCWVKAFLI